MLCSRLSSLVLLVLLFVAEGFPSYRFRFPNAHRIPCPDGAEGCLPGYQGQNQPASTCNGLGHATCQGGTFPLSAFGQSMEAAGYEWTREFCEEDSDGDGQSNGDELGDPCCLWTKGSSASPYMAAMMPSHPGNASHTQASPYVRPACDATMVPSRIAPEMAAFNPGEEQRSVEFRVKNYTLPEVVTTYVDIGFNFNDDSQDIFHIVYATVLLDLPKNLHHFVLTGCSAKIPEDDVGIPRHRPHKSCVEPLGGTAFWAPGVIMFTQPNSSGVPIGRGVHIVGINVNVHYSDGNLFPGSKSQDGFKMYYTPTLRPMTAYRSSVLRIHHSRIVIPPGKKRYFITRACNVRVAQPLPVIGVFYHAHLLGVEMYQELIRDGQKIDLGSQPIWHHDDQAVFGLMDRDLEIRPGDKIQSTCIYDSTSRGEETPMHVDTVAEMCWTNIITLAPTSAPPEKWQFGCGDTGSNQGLIWLGELAEGEDALLIPEAHPVSTAAEVYYGNGGNSGGRATFCLEESCEEGTAKKGAKKERKAAKKAAGKRKHKDTGKQKAKKKGAQ